MAKKNWVVRIIADEKDRFGLVPSQVGMFIECLRYAGVVKICKNDGNRIVFDLFPPKGVDSKAWASMNAARMKSFGINAADAPEWIYD